MLLDSAIWNPKAGELLWTAEYAVMVLRGRIELALRNNGSMIINNRTHHAVLIRVGTLVHLKRLV